MGGAIVRGGNTDFYLWDVTVPATAATLADRIGKAASIGAMKWEYDEQDTSDLDSVAKESEAGDIDYGSMSITQNLTDSEFSAMSDLKGKNLKYGLIVKKADGTNITEETCACWIKSCERGEIARGGLVKVTTELRLSGAPTFDFTEPVA